MRNLVLGNITADNLDDIKNIQRKLASVMNEMTVVLNVIKFNRWESGTCFKHAQNILSRAKIDSVRIARVIKKLESSK